MLKADTAAAVTIAAELPDIALQYQTKQQIGGR